MRSPPFSLPHFNLLLPPHTHWERERERGLVRNTSKSTTPSICQIVDASTTFVLSITNILASVGYCQSHAAHIRLDDSCWSFYPLSLFIYFYFVVLINFMRRWLCFMCWLCVSLLILEMFKIEELGWGLWEKRLSERVTTN